MNQKQAKTLWKAAHFKVTRLRAFTRIDALIKAQVNQSAHPP